MAFIGMRHVVAAHLTSHTKGSEPVYDGGMVVGHAIQGNLTITRNNNPLYGDDVIVEDDNSVTGMSLELGTDDLTEAVEVYLLGLKAKTVAQDATPEWLETDKAAPDVGLGYIRVRRKDGVTSFQAIWCFKAKFAKESESSATKGESIEWQTPTITGRMVGVDVDGSGDYSFRKRAVFTTEAAAIAWLDALADISAS